MLGWDDELLPTAGTKSRGTKTLSSQFLLG
jgi:hypothetical protein